MTTRAPARSRAKASANGAPEVSYSAPTGAVKPTTISTRADKPDTFMTLLTPTVAEMWLGHNSHNRTLRNKAVADLVGAIQRGEWQLNGDAIRFDTGGTLLDGQHRLWAVSESGVAVPTLVVVGLPPESQETVDVGARRSLRDALTLRGEGNGLQLAAVVTYWWRYEGGQVRNNQVRPTIAQALATLERHPGLRDASAWAKREFHKRFRGSTAMMACAHYELSSIDSDDAAFFFERLVDGTDLKAHDPILLLRKHFELLSMTAQQGARASALVSHALTIKAWNYWREGREIDRLNWKAAGMKAEAFPTPHA